MKILSPTNSITEVKQLIDSGCNELYVGVLTEEWQSTYHNSASVNRREWFSASLNSFSELDEVVKIAHDKDVRVYLTLNGLYTAPQYSLLEKELNRIVQSKVDAVIVADLGLMNKIAQDRIPLKIHVSTGGTTFNKSTISFYKKYFGVQRIIIPRHVTIDDIKDLSKTDEEIELEIFILNGRCPNIDGFCTFHHGMRFNLKRGSKQIALGMILREAYMKYENYLPTFTKKNNLIQKLFPSNTSCGLDYRVTVYPLEKKMSLDVVENVRQHIFNSYVTFRSRYACGCCALYRLKDCKIESIKIVGRDNPTEKKIKDIRFLKSVLELLKELPNEFDYTSAVRRLYRDFYGFDCNRNCYYEVSRATT